MLDTKPLLYRSGSDFPAVQRGRTRILQLNLGYLCNLSCTHCHVNAGPKRTEMMSDDVIENVKQLMDHLDVETLDLTGGAPEMHSQFRDLVRYARAKNIEVIDRCNLTILNEPGYEDLAEFLASNGVRVVASLPCYSEQNVDAQRGKGVFESSIEGLQQLNQLGYGCEDSPLQLDLVYNPSGAFLPPPQAALQADYKKALFEKHGIHFNSLLTLTNMPISRFGAILLSKGEFDPYMDLLRNNFNHDNLMSLMCRDTLSIDWQGYVYDCDFNQMLELPLKHNQGKLHVSDLLSVDLNNNEVLVADHCYGCTAGQGSSCGGALA